MLKKKVGWMLRINQELISFFRCVQIFLLKYMTKLLYFRSAYTIIAFVLVYYRAFIMQA